MSEVEVSVCLRIFVCACVCTSVIENILTYTSIVWAERHYQAPSLSVGLTETHSCHGLRSRVIVINTLVFMYRGVAGK